MTIAQAFAIAGYPAPEGARITYYESNQYWMWTTPAQHAGFAPGENRPIDCTTRGAVGWTPPSKTYSQLAIPAYACPDLADLPAKAFWKQLPNVITTCKAVVDNLEESPKHPQLNPGDILVMGGGRGAHWPIIDTAPKDGTKILIWSEEGGIEIGWFMTGEDVERWIEDAKEDESDWVPIWTTEAAERTNGEYGSMRDGSPHQPTHWTPLPEAPASSTADRCEQCGTTENVSRVIDPYILEIQGKEVERDLCASCEHDRRMDI